MHHHYPGDRIVLGSIVGHEYVRAYTVSVVSVEPDKSAGISLPLFGA